MKLKNFSKLMLLAFVLMCVAPSCVKEGPMGPAGANGTDGTNGKDGANGIDGINGGSDCKLCHNPASVDLISTQYQFSKHGHGEAAFEESGNVACAPCHAQEAFKDIVARDVQPLFTVNADGKYSLKYSTQATTAYGNIGCSTCHNQLHTTYSTADLAFTTVKPVPMVMWGAAKTIDLKADGGKSNLCVKCHQPRAQSNLQTGNVQDYASVAANPTVMAYDANDDKATTNIVRPSYRMHLHYGAVGAVYAGMGGVEFEGPETYKNSAHTAVASCVDCHMGAMNERAGGHTFFMRNSVPHTGLTAQTKWNFNGCNATGCHTTPIDSKSSALWVTPRAEIKTLLDNLAAKLNVGGVDILNKSNDKVANLWFGITTNNYDGYVNVYDPTLNPGVGTANVSGTFQNTGNTSSYTADQKAYNTSLPKLSLTNAQYGSILNFQLALRDYSLGIHNFAYTKALLTNSISKL